MRGTWPGLRCLQLAWLLSACGANGARDGDPPPPQVQNACGYEIRTSCRGATGTWRFGCAGNPYGPVYCQSLGLRETFERGCLTEYRNAVDAPDCETASRQIDARNADPCADQPDCAACTAQSSCGWCDGRCYVGTSEGPTGARCGASDRWAWLGSQCE